MRRICNIAQFPPVAAGIVINHPAPVHLFFLNAKRLQITDIIHAFPVNSRHIGVQQAPFRHSFGNIKSLSVSFRKIPKYLFLIFLQLFLRCFLTVQPNGSQLTFQFFRRIAAWFHFFQLNMHVPPDRHPFFCSYFFHPDFFVHFNSSFSFLQNLLFLFIMHILSLLWSYGTGACYIKSFRQSFLSADNSAEPLRG